MRLPREIRNALFAGERPKITFSGDEDCPIQIGHVEVLSSNVSFEVTATPKDKEGNWSLQYTVFDKRAHHRFLARQQGQMPNPNLNYVNNPSRGIDLDAGEAVDEFTQRRITEKSKQEQRKAIEELFVVLEDLRSAVNERLAGNPEARKLMGRDAWALKSKIDSVERRLKRRHAA